MPITNEAGQVAVKYLKQIPRYIKLGNGHEYVFSVTRNISMSWVEPEDVPAVFNIKDGCCGGAKKTAFVYVNERDMEIMSL